MYRIVCVHLVGRVGLCSLSQMRLHLVVKSMHILSGLLFRERKGKGIVVEKSD